MHYFHRDHSIHDERANINFQSIGSSEMVLTLSERKMPGAF